MNWAHIIGQAGREYLFRDGTIPTWIPSEPYKTWEFLVDCANGWVEFAPSDYHDDHWLANVKVRV